MYTKRICRNIRINSAEHTRVVLGLHLGPAQKVFCVSSCFSTSLHPQRDVRTQSVARGVRLQRPKMRGPYTTLYPQSICCPQTGLRKAVSDTICLKIAFRCNKLHHTKRFADEAQWEIWAAKGLSKAHPDNLSSTYVVTSLT